MEIITALFITNWKLISGGIVAIGAWHKDAIMAKLNIRKGSGEADSIHIQNSEQLMTLYRKSVEDLNAVNDDHKRQLRENHKEEIDDIKAEHVKNLLEMREANEFEKTSLKVTVEKLEKQVCKLTRLVERLGKQIAFYKENSDLQLPDDLQD